jgi:hypothetical protein
MRLARRFASFGAGHSAPDLASYIADARASELPLHGGGRGSAIEGLDWEYLLTLWRVLPYDIHLAKPSRSAGEW